MTSETHTFKGSRCVTEKWADGIFLFKLCTPPSQRRKGYARKLLKEIINNTDRPIYLRPEPWGDEPVSAADLTRFYESLGFREFASEQFKDLGFLVNTATPILRFTPGNQ